MATDCHWVGNDDQTSEETPHPHHPPFAPNWDKAAKTFDGMHLRGELLKGVYAYGFECPSSIQQLAIVPMIGVPRAWPLLGTSADAALHWSPLVHRKAQIAVVMTVLLIGERLRRCCDREWVAVDGEGGGVGGDGAGAGGVVSAVASLTLDHKNSNVNANVYATVNSNSSSSPLAGLGDTLPTEVWLEILGMVSCKIAAAQRVLHLLENTDGCTVLRIRYIR